MLLIIILFAGAVALATCQSDCQKFGQNSTMCIYPAESGCYKGGRGVDDDTIAIILQAHNTRRQEVANAFNHNQLSAANMYELTWDADLAAVAQRLADQCEYDHEGDRGTPKYRSVGQNVAKIYASSLDSTPDFVANAIAPWFDEVPRFSLPNLGPFRLSEATAHHTQLIWAETRQVGCGFAVYGSGAHRNTKSYICNYGPAGNIIGDYIYRMGNPCSGCTNCSTTYDGLCSP